METTEEQKQANKDFFLYKVSRGTSFSHMLFDLIHKADAWNQIKLSKAYPEHMKIYERWYSSENENEFFNELRKEIQNESA